MVAVVTGSLSGLSNSSLGLRQLGNSRQGTAADKLYVNAASGNLVLQRQDELLKSTGPNASLLHTYDSQGRFGDDNGVTGFNHNPGAGYSHQPTNMFWIKGKSSVSVVPVSPTKGQ